MARIKINELPEDSKISKEDMKNVLGGGLITEPLPANLANKAKSLAGPDRVITGIQSVFHSEYATYL